MINMNYGKFDNVFHKIELGHIDNEFLKNWSLIDHICNIYQTGFYIRIMNNHSFIIVARLECMHGFTRYVDDSNA